MPCVSTAHFERRAQAVFRDEKQLALVVQALALATKAHGRKVRIGGGNVLEEHILPVSLGVMNSGATHNVVAAALLHDVIEEAPKCENEIKEIGMDVYALVEILSRDSEMSNENYFERIGKSRDASLIKVQDRINNLLCIKKIGDFVIIKQYCRETVKFVMPIANKWGFLESETVLRELVSELLD